LGTPLFEAVASGIIFVLLNNSLISPESATIRVSTSCLKRDTARGRPSGSQVIRATGI